MLCVSAASAAAFVDQSGCHGWRCCAMVARRVPLALMMCIALVACCAVAAVELPTEPVPAVHPYPNGPLFTLSIPDVPRLRARLATSWYGALATRALDDAARARLGGFIDQGADLTGIDLRGLLPHLTAITASLQTEVAFRIDLDAPAAPMLLGVPAAAERDRRRAEGIIATDVAAISRLRLGQVDTYQMVPVMARVPAQPDGDGVVIARSRTFWGEDPVDGVRIVAQGATLLGGGLGAEPAQGGAGDADLQLTADLAALVASLGIPGAEAMLRASGATEVAATVSLASGRSSETIRLPGAHLPLRALDTAVLEAEVPADALTLSAVGLDGPALAALAVRAASADPLAVTAWGPDTAILAEVDGPAWVAIVPALPLPDMVLAIPAGPGLDARLRAAWPDDGGSIDAARQAPVKVTPKWIGAPIWIRRSARAWLISTEEHLLTRLGNPGLAGRLRTQHGLPAGALGLALQANQAILHRLGALVPLARAALSLHAISGGELPLPFLDGLDAVTAGALLDVLERAALAPQVPTTLAWVETDGGGAVLRGHDLVIGAGVLPTAALLVAAAPQIARDNTIGWSPLIAALLVANQGDEARVPALLAWRRELGGMPAVTEQLLTLAAGSPSAEMRAQASAALPGAQPDADPAALLPWLRAGLADTQAKARRGAVRGLGGALAVALTRKDGPGDAVMAAFLATLVDPRPEVRTEAAHQALILAKAVRERKHSEAMIAAFDELIIARATNETQSRARAWVLRALPPHGGPRALAAVQAALATADAVVRDAALATAGTALDGDAPAALVAAIVALRGDRSALELEPYTVGNAALLALCRLRGPDADAALLAELQAAPQADAGPISQPVHGAAGRINAAAALVERLQPAGLAAAAAIIAECEHMPAPNWTSDLAPLTGALGGSRSDGSEALLVRLLSCPDRMVAQYAAMALQRHAQIRPLSGATIAALDVCVAAPGAWARIAARRLLDRTALTAEQRTVLAAKVAAANAAFGPNAFLNYQPPPPVIKPGADDF